MNKPEGLDLAIKHLQAKYLCANIGLTIFTSQQQKKAAFIPLSERRLPVKK